MAERQGEPQYEEVITEMRRRLLRSLMWRTYGILARVGGIWRRAKSIKEHLLQKAHNLYFNSFLRPRILQDSLTKRVVAAVLRKLNIKVLFNLVPGLGHNTVELDMFFRMRALGLVADKDRVALIREANAIHRDTLSLYRKRFWLGTSSRVLLSIVIPAAASAPDLQIDCGLSRLKWNYDPNKPLAVPFGGQTYLHQVSKGENREAWKRYFEIRRRTLGISPLKEGIGLDFALEKFLSGLERPLALVHIKKHIANATAAATDPLAYVQAIEFLKKRGYRVVQVGREPMPPIFKEIGVLNYAGSSIASYRHDLQIFAAAALAITAGSGIALLADCMGTPLVYLDSWHLGMPMASACCVMVPALVRDKATGRTLSFREQLDLYFSLEDGGAEIFPCSQFLGRNAEPYEILAAVKEACELSNREAPLSELQCRYRDLDRDGLGSLSRARISAFFIQKHAELLS